MIIKKCSLFIVLLVTAMPSHAIINEVVRCAVGGGFLVGSVMTGNQCYQEFKLATAAPGFAQKGKDLYDQLREKLNDAQINRFQKAVKNFSARYGTTLCWGALTVILVGLGCKVLYNVLGKV